MQAEGIFTLDKSNIFVVIRICIGRLGSVIGLKSLFGVVIRVHDRVSDKVLFSGASWILAEAGL